MSNVGSKEKSVSTSQASSTGKLQHSNATRFNRYPGIFRTIQTHLAETKGASLGGQDLRILSFGCSSGEEIQSLRAYFPDATIMGCDIDTGILQAAREQLIDDSAIVFESNHREILARGPFDVIMCGSVLCTYPLSVGTNDLSSDFPFSKFSDAMGTMDEGLKEGGLIGIYNSNYFVSDLDQFSKYGVVKSPLIEANGFVDKFFSDGKRCTAVARGAGRRSYAHSLVDASRPRLDSDFCNSLYVKGNGVTCATGPQIQDTPEVPQDAELVLGFNPWKLQKQSSYGAGLYRWQTAGDDGAPWTASTWIRSSMEQGTPISLGTYWTPGPRRA